MHRCWFVTLDPEYPSWLSPLTGSRTSGPAIFAIYLLLVIGLTGESQAEHKRMLFMDAWKKRRERARPSYVGNPCSIFQLRSDRSPFEIAVSEFSEQNFSIPSCGIVCYLNFLYYIQVLGYVVCREEIGEGKRGRFLRGDCFQKGKFRLLVSVSDDILSRWRVRDESNLNSLKYVWIWLNDILRLNCWLELIQI